MFQKQTMIEMQGVTLFSKKLCLAN